MKIAKLGAFGSSLAISLWGMFAFGGGYFR